MRTCFANGQPRPVREAIAKLQQYQQTDANAHGLVIAPFLTPMSARICRQNGVGYLDLSGNCHLNFDFIFVSKTGRYRCPSASASGQVLKATHAIECLRIGEDDSV